MDVRDYLAGQAINGLIRAGQDDIKSKDLKKLAALAYQVADAMLAHREQAATPVLLAEIVAPEGAEGKRDNGKKKNKKTKKTANGATPPH